MKHYSGISHFFVLWMSAGFADASADPSSIRVRRSTNTGLASFVTAADRGPLRSNKGGRPAILQPEDAVKEFGPLFGLTNPVSTLMVENSQGDALGQTHTTFVQMHRGIRVFSGVLKVHQNARGEATAINGDYYPIKGTMGVNAHVDEIAAARAARTTIRAPMAKLESAELVIVDPGWYGDPPLGPRLAHHLILAAEDRGIRDAFFVDALRGEILDHWSLVHTSLFREVHDGGLMSELPGPVARMEGEGAVGKPVDVDRAYDYLGDVYDYYSRGFGRDSMNALGLPLVATVRSTAFGCPNAFWSGQRLQMGFCNGVAADDVVAHELTHGLTQFTAGLIYQNQSGQLNESFSDVFGELVDLYNGDAAFAGPPAGAHWPDHLSGPGVDFPNAIRSMCNGDGVYPDGVRWMVAEDSTAFSGAIRDMWDPTCEGDPDRANSPLQTCSDFDNGGVHSGSGIPNHAFAMLTDGKTFNGYTVTGIGPIKAGAVWFRALTIYLTVASDFEDAFFAFTQSAQDLVGSFPADPRTGLRSDVMFTSFDADQVELALRAVEMDRAGRCGATVEVLDSRPVHVCAQREVVFRDDFENGPGDWMVEHHGIKGDLPTPYDWMIRSELPYHRDGAAWFCDDPNVGDCDTQDESGVHSLISPEVVIPNVPGVPMLVFTHYLASEPGWDGGLVMIQINSEGWKAVPGRAFRFNSYSSPIRPLYYGNTNPLNGREGWTGVGGQWGTSWADLSDLVHSGDMVRFRFDFGKDGCTGSDGWYVDDVEIFVCEDCDGNGRPDALDLSFMESSGLLFGVDGGSARSITLHAPPPAAGDVSLHFRTIADLGLNSERLNAYLNGVFVGAAFAEGGRDCPYTPDAATLTIPAELFNEVSAGDNAVVTIVPSNEVGASVCGPISFVSIQVEYDSAIADMDGGRIPDYCENCQSAVAPLPEPLVVPKNRYLSAQPGGISGRLTALRLTTLELPSPFEAQERLPFWVGRPRVHTENSDGLFAVAEIGCEPTFVDWGELEVIHIYGHAIMPSARYKLDAIDLACHRSQNVDAFSAGMILATSDWGDVAGVDGSGVPDGKVNLSDVGATIDAYRAGNHALPRVRGDIAPAVPNQIIDFADISAVVEAFRGLSYPYSGPRRCP